MREKRSAQRPRRGMRAFGVDAFIATRFVPMRGRRSSVLQHAFPSVSSRRGAHAETWPRRARHSARLGAARRRSHVRARCLVGGVDRRHARPPRRRRVDSHGAHSALRVSANPPSRPSRRRFWSWAPPAPSRSFRTRAPAGCAGARALPVAAAAVLGSIVGSRLSGRIEPDALRRGFAWFVVVMAVFVLGQEVPKLFGVTVSLARHWPWLLAAMCAPPAIAAASAHRHAHAV